MRNACPFFILEECSMKELVQIRKFKGLEDVFTDSMVIAKGTNNQHEFVIIQSIIIKMNLKN